jgi:S-(hydroxymethyl)glutathione dehydrogenase/alcohol dehydrogenase
MEIKAAVLHQPNQPLTVERLDVREPARGEVLVRTATTGVCHSDLHFADGSWPMKMPAVLGHEASGIVEKVGEGVTYVQPGDHVILSFSPFCGRCAMCVTGNPHLCTDPAGRTPAPEAGPRITWDGREVTQMASMGSFGELMVVPEGGLVRIEKDFPLDKAALVGCGVMTGVGAVLNTAKVPEGATVVVVGCGGVGLNVIQGAVLASAGRIIAVDLLPKKLEMARQFGATDVVNGAETDPVAAVKEMTKDTVDFAFEAIGNVKAARQCFDMVRRGGTAVIVGMMPWGSEISVPGPAFLGEKKLIGCFYGSTRQRVDMPRLLNFYKQGKLKLDELVTKRWELGQVNEAFAAMKNGEVARSIIPMLS